RYTYAGADGITIAASVEEPTWEYVDNGVSLPGGPTAAQINGFLAGTTRPAVVTAADGGGATNWNRYPDFVVKGRLDQAWGHVALAGAVRDQEVYSIGIPRHGETGWAMMLSGHLNTFGKDTLRGGFLGGQAVGHFLSDMREPAGLQTSGMSAAGN